VVKTLKGTAGLVSNLIDQMTLINVLGCTYGDDTVMIITPDLEDAYIVKQKLNEMIV
jgi:arginine repressor